MEGHILLAQRMPGLFCVLCKFSGIQQLCCMQPERHPNRHPNCGQLSWTPMMPLLSLQSLLQHLLCTSSQKVARLFGQCRCKPLQLNSRWTPAATQVQMQTCTSVQLQPILPCASCPDVKVHIEAVVLPPMVQGQGDGGAHEGEGRGAFVKVSEVLLSRGAPPMLQGQGDGGAHEGEGPVAVFKASMWQGAHEGEGPGALVKGVHKVEGGACIQVSQVSEAGATDNLSEACRFAECFESSLLASRARSLFQDEHGAFVRGSAFNPYEQDSALVEACASST
eukprot:1149345-Pelagomonas_calceolata.AAC.12